ncbi:hypothetical protein INR49_002119 [Caranx melampygus]|nr:hypothetical protein INR49_002119 [Caranx melampygus]
MLHSGSLRFCSVISSSSSESDSSSELDVSSSSEPLSSTSATSWEQDHASLKPVFNMDDAP